jgi:hypothetical protein
MTEEDVGLVKMSTLSVFFDILEVGTAAQHQRKSSGRLKNGGKASLFRS